MAKSKIMIAVENIIGKHSGPVYVDSRVNGCRIKFGFMNPFPKNIEEKILKLPNVTSVGFAPRKNFYTIWGATIHFNKKLRDIDYKLPEKEKVVKQKEITFAKKSLKSKIWDFENSVSYFEDLKEKEKIIAGINNLSTIEEIKEYYLYNRGWYGESSLMVILMDFLVELAKKGRKQFVVTKIIRTFRYN